MNYAFLDTWSVERDASSGFACVSTFLAMHVNHYMAMNYKVRHKRAKQLRATLVLIQGKYPGMMRAPLAFILIFCIIQCFIDNHPCNLSVHLSISDPKKKLLFATQVRAYYPDILKMPDDLTKMALKESHAFFKPTEKTMSIVNVFLPPKKTLKLVLSAYFLLKGALCSFWLFSSSVNTFSIHCSTIPPTCCNVTVKQLFFLLSYHLSIRLKSEGYKKKKKRKKQILSSFSWNRKSALSKQWGQISLHGNGSRSH